MLKPVKTKDGSMTFHSSQYDETYHSISGAEEEAVKKFVEPCRIAEKAKTGKIAILDICFGLGYNSAAAIDAAKKANPDCDIEIVGLENDKEILGKIEVVESSFESYGSIRKKDNKQVKIIIDDARESIKRLRKKAKKFDAVFLDPFSPKRCPELWTEEFFRDIKSLMKADAILATYSCARVVRENLKNAGFRVMDGPVVGRKSPGTIATPC